jgi:molybdopterin converting factor small subunit
MTVLIPPPLHSYTGGISRVSATGRTLREVLGTLDARFPGIRFRIVDEQDAIRPHIKFFIDGEMVPGIEHPVADDCEVMIVCALSGG